MSTQGLWDSKPDLGSRIDGSPSTGPAGPMLHEARSTWLTYETFYGLREKPFSLSSDSRFFYRSRSHALAIGPALYRNPIGDEKDYPSRRLTVQEAPIKAIATEAGTATKRRQISGRRRNGRIAAVTAATTVNWPSSTPTLKPTSAGRI